MEITEVRIKLMDDPNDRLRAFCSITFDAAFVIRDLKIIEGTKGAFVAMPSRKLTDRCPRCGCKNHLRGSYCNQCGAALGEYRATQSDDGRAKLYADIAHPINSDCREMIQARVLNAFENEVLRSGQPDYVCTYDDYGEERYATLKDEETMPVQPDFKPTEPEPAVAEPAVAEPAGAQAGPNAGDETRVTEAEPALPMQPATLVHPDRTSHRIEPAADQQGAGPHTSVGDQADVIHEGLTQTACEDDNFGAGVV